MEATLSELVARLRGFFPGRVVPVVVSPDNQYFRDLVRVYNTVPREFIGLGELQGMDIDREHMPAMNLYRHGLYGKASEDLRSVARLHPIPVRDSVPLRYICRERQMALKFRTLWTQYATQPSPIKTFLRLGSGHSLPTTFLPQMPIGGLQWVNTQTESDGGYFTVDGTIDIKSWEGHVETAPLVRAIDVRFTLQNTSDPQITPTQTTGTDGFETYQGRFPIDEVREYVAPPPRMFDPNDAVPRFASPEYVKYPYGQVL